MKDFLTRKIYCPLLFVLLIAIGCGKHEVAPPEPIAVDQLPSVFQKTFASAKPEVKELSDKVVASVQAQDYSKAFLDLQALSASPNLTKEQSNVAAGAIMTVSDLMKTAISQGDQKSATTLRQYQMTK